MLKIKTSALCCMPSNLVDARHSMSRGGGLSPGRRERGAGGGLRAIRRWPPLMNRLSDERMPTEFDLGITRETDS